MSGPSMAETLGELIRERRTAKGLSQGALGKRLGVSVEYVSKLERSAIRVPNEKVVSKLAKELGLGEEQIRELVKKPSPERTRSTRSEQVVAASATQERLRIISGHVCWSSAAVLALLAGRFRNFRLATFAVDGEPVWLDGGSLTSSEQLDRSLLPGRRGGKARSYSANDVRVALSSGAADLGILPFSLLEATSDLKPFVTLLDSSAGCCIVGTEHMVQQTDLQRPRSLSISELPGPDGAELVVVSELGTVAREEAKELKDSYPRRYPGSEIRLQHLSTAEIGTMSLQEIAARFSSTPQRTLVISWDPQASWLCENSKAKEPALDIMSRSLTSSQHHKDRMKFGVVMSTTRPQAPAQLWPLVEELWRRTSELQAITMRGNATPESIRMLATYFGLAEERDHDDPEASAEKLYQSLCMLDFHVNPAVDVFSPLFSGGTRHV